MTKVAKLRELFKKEGIVRIVGAHDGLSAKIAEDCGFDGIWASGLEISTSYAVPDANILSMNQYLERACEMNDVVSLPVLADCDTGFGNSNNVIHMVKKYEAAGIAAVCIEDKHFPKVNSFVPGRQELAPISEFVGKILAAKNAQTSKDFMVIARVEALIAGWGMEEALKRACAYVDAGADTILIHSKSDTIGEIAGFIKLWNDRAPLVVVPTTYFHINTKELEKLKVKMVIYANHGIRASIRAMQDTFRQIFQAGTSSPVEDKIVSMKEVFEIQGMHKMKEDELIYSHSGKDRVVAVIPAAGDHMEEYSMKDISADIPVSMLDINGKSLLKRQVEVLNRCKVYDIYVVAGYKKEKINVEGIKIVSNDLFRKTGAAYSLMQALEHIDASVFITYGDVLFDHIIFERIRETQKDITIIADKNFDSRNYGPDKKIDFVVTEDGKLPKTHRVLHTDSLKRAAKIGSSVLFEEAQYEFPGITFLSGKGTRILKETYKKKKNKFRNAGIADLLQEVIICGVDVYCLETNSGWMEIHSMENYSAACAIVK